MLDVQVTRDELHFGASVTVRFMRTRRPTIKNASQVPPQDLGSFPIYCIDDYLDRVPASWRIHRGVFVPVHQCEAMWLSFSGRRWKPNAIKVGTDEINAVTGNRWCECLSDDPRNYLVCPAQSRLNGICSGDPCPKQWVPPGLGVEDGEREQVSGRERDGRLQLMVFEPKPGRFPDALPSGGSANQASEYTADAWGSSNFGKVYIHLVNSKMFHEITGGQLSPSTFRKRSDVASHQVRKHSKPQ